MDQDAKFIFISGIIILELRNCVGSGNENETGGMETVGLRLGFHGRWRSRAKLCISQRQIRTSRIVNGSA